MPPAAITVQRRIEWSDTDASGHYHNTAAFRMFEWAETALLEALGFLDDVYGRLPRVQVSANFHAPLNHRDLVDVELTVAAVGRTSVTYVVVIRHGETVCVKARLTAVLLSADRRPTEWPDEYRAALLGAGRQSPELLVRGNVAGAPISHAPSTNEARSK